MPKVLMFMWKATKNWVACRANLFRRKCTHLTLLVRSATMLVKRLSIYGSIVHGVVRGGLEVENPTGLFIRKWWRWTNGCKAMHCDLSNDLLFL
ncbi:hypothetical protein RHMOL_Rhmol06G0244100 [Rhododendron molle]|uniref:Uncharacterized protein n=1 Tax=Rhododendron molle TaxID=49168 RepID=A0ACC0NHV1_RHOML|nr:hypothetical protein RHMOL_Rhmol06G0244100 [Rhododendron molle]